MKAALLITLCLLTSIAAHAGSTWVDENSHNTVIVQAIDNIFNPAHSKDLYFRIKGPVFYGECDLGAKLTAKLIPVSKTNNERTFYVDLGSESTGDNGKCAPGEPVHPIAFEDIGKSGWLKAKAGLTLMLVMPPEYSVEIKK